MTIHYKLHEKGERPWGEWEVTGIGQKSITKKITVKPHASLSLQLHHHRAEHWVIVSGEPIVTIGDQKHKLKPSEVVDIPAETKHRIENPTDKLVEFIETQTGEILDEADIVRFEDIYNRVDPKAQQSR